MWKRPNIQREQFSAYFPSLFLFVKSIFFQHSSLKSGYYLLKYLYHHQTNSDKMDRETDINKDEEKF